MRPAATLVAWQRTPSGLIIQRELPVWLPGSPAAHAYVASVLEGFYR